MPVSERTPEKSGASLSELDWPADVRKLAQAFELLERTLEALDPDCYLDLCAEIQRFLND